MGDVSIAQEADRVKRKMAGEPKCGSKTGFMVLMIISYVLGGIITLVPLIVGSCGCTGCGETCVQTDCWGKCEDTCTFDSNGCIKAKSPSLTGGAWLAMVIIGVLILICGCVFTCGACACCCFQG